MGDEVGGTVPAQHNAWRRIHMPRNTGTGFVVSGFAAVFGFALIWHIWWLVAVCFAGMLISVITHSFNENRDYYVSADEVARIEGSHIQHLPS